MNYRDLRLLVSRLQLGPFLVKHGLTGTGVEVGTFEGEWAHGLLCGWPG